MANICGKARVLCHERRLFVDDGRILTLIVGAKSIIKPAMKGDKGTLHLPVGANEIPHLRALLISLGLPERCVW
jgi:hypothetical protein